MKKKNYTWLAALPYILGGSLFFIGAARFLSLDDKIGAVIAGFAGILALCLAFVSFARRVANSS